MNDESRPKAAHETPTKGSTSTIDRTSDVSEACDAFVILVLTPEGKYRRRVMLSLHAAEKAYKRAQAAGKPAHLVMCRLLPVAGGGPND